jgi:hypothetical protein
MSLMDLPVEFRYMLYQYFLDAEYYYHTYSFKELISSLNIDTAALLHVKSTRRYECLRTVC